MGLFSWIKSHFARKRREEQLRKAEELGAKISERRQVEKIGAGEESKGGSGGSAKSKGETLKVYHGISSTQRGGNSFFKLRSMIEGGMIYSKKEQPDDAGKFKLAIFKHALSKGIEEGKIDAEKYLSDEENYKELKSDPAVKKYLEDDNFRRTMTSFKQNEISMDEMMRSDITWVDQDEQSTQDTYGQEIYLEIKEPKSDVNMKFEGASIGRIAGPIDFNNVTKVVLSSQYKDNAKEIKDSLMKKGFKAEVEVRD